MPFRPQRLALLMLAAIPLIGQQYSHLSGLIRDPSDAAIVGAAITVANEETGFRRSAESGADGGYGIASLRPGTYKITVRKEGFRTIVRFGVKLETAQPARVDFTLPIGSMQETITVEGGPSLLNTQDAAVGTLVNRERIERMPLNGRGLLSLLELAPGTVVTPATRGEAGQFTANGQRPNTHYFTLDGVSVNSGVSGGGLPSQSTGGSLPGMTALGSLHGLVSLEALDEFRVQTSTTAPEFGRLPGAQVSLSSRSGSNEFHGAVFQYFRNEILDANDWFANRQGDSRAPLRMNDFGGALGGPVRRNRTFFFLSYEGMRLRHSFAWRSAVPSEQARRSALPWVQPMLNLFPRPNGGPLGEGLAEWTGRNQRPSRFDTGAARMDHALGGRITLFGRFSFAPSQSEFGNTQVNQLTMESGSVTAGMNARLSPWLVFDTRFNLANASSESLWWSTNPDAGTQCYFEPVTQQFFRVPGLCDFQFRFSFAGVGQAVWGRESDRGQKQWHLVPMAVISAGAHQIRAGADLRKLRPLRRDRTSALNLIAENFVDLLNGRNLWSAFARPLAGESILSEVSAFAQDSWRIHSRLTVTGGMRWEYAPPPRLSPLASSPELLEAYRFDNQTEIWPARYRNFAPRAGAAFKPFVNRDFVVRGGFGLYYDSSLSIATDLVNGGPFILSRYTNPKNAPFSTLLSYGFMPGLVLPLARQWNVTAEQAFGGRDVLSLSYAGSAGRRLLRRELGAPVSTQSFQIALVTNHGASVYHGLQVQYRLRSPRGINGLFSYSWSHSIDNSSSDSALHWVSTAWRAMQDRGSSDFDTRHSFSGALSYSVKPNTGSWWRRARGAWELDAIVRARSGFPITALSSEFALGVGFANAFRPNVAGGQPLWISDRAAPGGRKLNPLSFAAPISETQGNLGRNSLYGFSMSQIDFALRRRIPLNDRAALHLRFEVFNALNRPNFADPVRSLASPLFGQTPSLLNLMLGTGSPGSGLTPVFQTGGPRSVQVVVRFQF
jgi:hypothetical protein